MSRYEQFVGVLCDAAKNGLSAAQESEYLRLRRWFMEHYYTVAPGLRPYLNAVFHDEKAPLARRIVLQPGTSLFRKMDPFERVFEPTSIRKVLERDSGQIITRLSLLSEAIYTMEDEEFGGSTELRDF